MSGEKKIAGKVVMVTGAGRGIGQAIALAFADQGASVVAVDLNLADLDATIAHLNEKRYRSLALAGDVSNWGSVQDFVGRACAEFGGIHVLVNNAGIQGPIGPLVENDPDLWAQTIQVNLMGIFFCCKAVLPYMMKQRYGKIINMSGGGATSPRVSFSAYGASKAAVVRLTETLAEEVRDYGIQVNAIAPGAVNTRMLKETLAAGDTAGKKALAEAQRQLETGGTPPELAADLVVFLASDASAGLTGKLIAAPYDDWRDWDARHIKELMSAPWFTLRRIDPYTIQPFVEMLKDKVE